MKKIVLLALSVLLALQVFSHGVQVAYEVRNDGTIRVWIEHWHGSTNNVSSYPLDVQIWLGSTMLSSQTYYADGYANGTATSSLPTQGTLISLYGCSSAESTGSCYANSCNNWVYWDFNPPVCNQTIDLVIVDGPASTTQEGCSNLYPQTITASFNDTYGPTITANNLTANNTNCTGAIISDFSSVVSVTDNCDNSPVVTYSPVEGSFFPLGNTTVNVTATDVSGNSSNSSFTVSVVAASITNTLDTTICAGDTMYIGASAYTTAGTHTTTLTSSCGTDSVVTLNLGVQALPLAQSETINVCNNTSFTISPTITNGVNAVEYEWYVDANSNVSGQANSTTKQADITQTLSNNTSTIQTVVYHVTPYTEEVSYNVGDTYGGGMIAYIMQPGDNGYVAGQQTAIIAQSTFAANPSGACSPDAFELGSSTAATSQLIGEGMNNTNNLYNAGNTSGDCISFAYNYNDGTYSDWFIPSKDELYEVLNNLNTTFSSSGGYYIRSSSETVGNISTSYSYFPGAPPTLNTAQNDGSCGKVILCRYATLPAIPPVCPGDEFIININVSPADTVIDTQVACESYTWIDGSTYTASNNSATYTLTNAAGCDSVVALDLTINYMAYDTMVVTACDSYTWIDGVTYTSSNNSATHTLQTVNGCDSVITLDLTINISGCTDSTMFNYNASAVCDDGSCIPFVYGCTDANASNYDATANTDDGSCLSCPGRVGFDFSTAYGYLHTPFANYSFDSLTVEFWINIPNLTANQHYFSLAQQKQIQVGHWSGNTISTNLVGVSPVNLHTDTNTIANEWHHVAFTFDGSTETLYLDGVAIESATTTGSLMTNTTWNDGLVLGARYTTNTQYFDGQMSDVRLWEVARTSAEINANMNTTLTGAETGLIAYYPLNDGAGSTTVTDLTGNGHDLTLYNFNSNTSWINEPTTYPTASADTVTACDSYTFGGVTYTSSGDYTWQGTNVAGCDSTATLHLTINNSTSSTDVQVACDSYTWIDGNTYTTSNNSATHTLTNAAGCDSVVTLDLTINYEDDSYQNVSLLNGHSFEYHDSTYTVAGYYHNILQTVEGCDSTVYTELTVFDNLLDSLNAVYCDNEAAVPLPSQEQYPYFTNWTQYYVDGIAIDTLDPSALSEGNHQLSVEVLGPDVEVDYSTGYYWTDLSAYTDTLYFEDDQERGPFNIGFDFIWFDTTYSEIYIDANGKIAFDEDIDEEEIELFEEDLDPENEGTIKMVTLGTAPNRKLVVEYDSIPFYGEEDYAYVRGQIVLHETTGYIDINIDYCEQYYADESIYIGLEHEDEDVIEFRYDEDDPNLDDWHVRFIPFIDVLDSDSMSFTILNTDGLESVTSCDSYTWIDGVTYTSSNNTATHTLTNALGCDSVVTLDLTINYSSTGVDVITSCDSYTWIDGVTYTASNNTATHTLTNALGCDSVVTLDLTINYANAGSSSITSCDEYDWNGQLITVSGNYTQQFTNTSGCDSTHTLTVTINSSTASSQQVSFDYGYSITVGNSVYTDTGVYIDTLTTALGCDSIVTTDLTVFYYEHFTQDVTICADEDISVNGNTYNQTGVYVDTIAVSGMADSVMTTTLTVLPVPVLPVIYQMWSTTLSTTDAFDAYQWYRNGNALVGDTNQTLNIFQSGWYTVEVFNNDGCGTLSDGFGFGVSGIDEATLAEFKLYPNPTRSLIHLELPSSLGTDYLLEVYDFTGRLLRTYEGSQRPTLRPVIDFGQLSQGNYQVVVKYSDGSVWNQSVIKQ